MSNISEKFMEISGKIGSQRHLIAIRDSFISMMPITMAGRYSSRSIERLSERHPK